MPLFKKRSNEKDILSRGQDIVDPVDLLYRLLDQLYDVAEKTSELVLLLQDRELRRIRLPEELKHSLNNLRKIIDLVLSKCG